MIENYIKNCDGSQCNKCTCKGSDKRNGEKKAINGIIDNNSRA